MYFCELRERTPQHNKVRRHSRVAVQAGQTCSLVPVRFLCALASL